MAAKKSKSKAMTSASARSMKCDDCGCAWGGRCSVWALVLLLVAGLGHVFPGMMAPILGIGLLGVSVQTLVGAGAVAFAVYSLLGKN